MNRDYSEEETEEVVINYVKMINQKLENNNYSAGCLSDVEKTVLFAYEMELEVKNGGIHQYFYNSTGNDWKEMLNALHVIRADSIIALFEKALAVFPDGSPSKDREKRWRQLAGIGKEGEGKLEELSQEYFSIYENSPDQDIYSKLGRYIITSGE